MGKAVHRKRKQRRSEMNGNLAAVTMILMKLTTLLMTTRTMMMLLRLQKQLPKIGKDGLDFAVGPEKGIWIFSRFFRNQGSHGHKKTLLD